MTENTTTIARQVGNIEFSSVPYFSERDIAYTTADSRIDSFIKYPVNIESFSKVFRDKLRNNTDRALLTSVLRKQYNELDSLDAHREKIINQLNNKDTFTIVTAHQPCLFTGPLYVVYKIIAAINAAKTLNEYYGDKTVLPVYIIGGEDHDFEEINNTSVFNNHLKWENENARGSVGRMSTESMASVLDELHALCNNDESALKWYRLMKDAYENSTTYGLASRKIIHELFQNTDLLILSMDDKELKSSFSEIISKEVLKEFSAPYVREAQENIRKAGFEVQAYVRDINFFYLSEEGRNRIEFIDGKYNIVDTDMSFTASEIAQEIDEHPERFSPNVIMRPIYQEFILPNLAYIGGGGELAYWMERKTQFEAFDLNFPMLIRRNSLILLDKRAQKDMEHFQLSIDELFDDIEKIVKDYTKEHSKGNVSLGAYRKDINKVFKEIAEQAKTIDNSLGRFVHSQESTVQKLLGHIEGKLMKAEKDRLSIELNKLRNLKDRVFPGNSLQERHDNFLSWVIRYEDKFWDKLYDSIDVFDNSVKVIAM